MNLNATEIKKLLKNWHFYKASILSIGSGSDLEIKLEKVEKAVNTLDDVNRTIIKMRFFERQEMEDVAKLVFMTRQAVYKRIKKTLETIVYMLS